MTCQRPEGVGVPRVAVLVARRVAEVVAVGVERAELPVVVAGCRPEAVQVPSPGRAEAVGVGVRAAGRVDVVPGGEDRAVDPVEQRGGRLVAVPVAAGDVAGADEGRGRRGGGARRSGLPSRRRRPDGVAGRGGLVAVAGGVDATAPALGALSGRPRPAGPDDRGQPEQDAQRGHEDDRAEQDLANRRRRHRRGAYGRPRTIEHPARTRPEVHQHRMAITIVAGDAT